MDMCEKGCLCMYMHICLNLEIELAVLLERTFSCMLYFEVQTLFYRDFLGHCIYGITCGSYVHAYPPT